MTIDTNLARAVQTLAGVDADGIIGNQTLSAIYLKLAGKPFHVDVEQASPASTVPVEVPSGSLDGKCMVGGKYTGIIDLHHGSTIDFGKLKSAGFGAVIHKASEGLTFQDPLYVTRKATARSQGFLWGAYHFAAKADGHQQAESFLRMEDGKDQSVLMVLDFEPSANGAPNMTLQQGRDFINAIFSATGRYPTIYGGGGLLRDLLEGEQDDVFSKCPLWLCDMRSHPKTILPIWPEWSLLQYAGDGQGQEPKDVPGSDGADRNSFNGTLADLRAAWPFRR